MAEDRTANPIPALRPQGRGHQFAFYGDSCSGVPGASHEETHARVNRVVARLEPKPEFIVYPGDEIMGLTADPEALRRQWRHWLDVEMAWLDRTATPLFNATSNHTTYDRMSERVFAEMLPHLPRNGPEDQKGLAYFVRCDDLLLVFIHTLASKLGGEGHIETAWLAETLTAHRDARWKFVVGHHPAYPVNGYAGAYQRTIGEEYVPAFWHILVEQGVTAYLCSHILAFDVQCHDGVLQITSAGAGTAHRMPEGIEYLHCVQMAVDESGLRYQVLDDTGARREGLSWPPPMPARKEALTAGEQALPWAAERDVTCAILHISGRTADDESGERQTLLALRDDVSGAMPLWLGLAGATQQLTAILQPVANRSPHYWFGPSFSEGCVFDIEVMLHREMGPGGLLWRSPEQPQWSSFQGVSPWGLERVRWPARCLVGRKSADSDDEAFRGSALTVAASWC